jgi:hypothetical protein
MTHTAKALARLLCVGLVASFTTVATLHAQSPETPPAHDRAAMMANCQSMMAGMKADQARLDELVAKMNAATGQLKVDQIAAVLTELVAHQKAMHAHMMSMGGTPAAPANPPKAQPEAGHEQHKH